LGEGFVPVDSVTFATDFELPPFGFTAEWSGLSPVALDNGLCRECPTSIFDEQAGFALELRS
jgi:hypothetical protein